MKYILGKKLNMGQVWNAESKLVPVTHVEAGPCTVVQVKTKERDGYSAVQIGYGRKRRVSKALQGHSKGSFAALREFRCDDDIPSKVADQVTVSSFALGDRVVVTGVSKGKGFQGVVKRHHFHGHPASHGHKDQLRTSGAIGVGDAAHVMKGKRMAGRMGTDRVTVKGLSVVHVDAEKNLIGINGAVPGARNGLVMIRTAQ